MAEGRCSLCETAENLRGYVVAELAVDICGECSALFRVVSDDTSTSHSSSSPSQLFLRDICDAETLTAQEEVELARRVGPSGDLDAKQKMAQSHLHLVVAVAKSHHGRGLPLLDLVQEGALGLVRAVETFDSSSGLTFSNYATPWIRQAITRAVPMSDA